MAVLKIPVYDETGQSVWPDKFTPEELETKRNVYGALKFAQQYRLETINLAGSKLKLDWLRLYDRDELPQDVTYFFGVDPSISGHGDHMAICVVAKSGDQIYLRDFVREQAKMERMIELIEREARIFPPVVVNVEAVQAQAYLVQALQERTTLPVRSYTPKGKKEDRIVLMAQVDFSTGKVLVRGRQDPDAGGLVPDDSMTQFVTEWVSYDPRRREQQDDMLDAAGSALEAAGASGVAACVSSEWAGIEEEEEEPREGSEPPDEELDEEGDESAYQPIWRRSLWV